MSPRCPYYPGFTVNFIFIFIVWLLLHGRRKHTLYSNLGTLISMLIQLSLKEETKITTVIFFGWSQSIQCPTVFLSYLRFLLLFVRLLFIWLKIHMNSLAEINFLIAEFCTFIPIGRLPVAVIRLRQNLVVQAISTYAHFGYTLELSLIYAHFSS